MDIGSLFFILGAALLAVFYIAAPLISRKGELPSAAQPLLQGDATNKRYSALLAERERLLRSLQELEADNALGKVPVEDYPLQRMELLKAGAAVLRQLDELKDEKDETGVAQSPAVQAVPAESAEDDELERLIAARMQSRQEKTGGFCPKCGKPVLASDQFCSRCGAQLKAG